MVSREVFRRFYPNALFEDCTLESARAFYGWVRQYANRDTEMLNLGAGGPAPRHRIRVFRGQVARVAGADIDPEVTRNPELDDAHIIEPDGHLPFADQSFDLVLSDWVVEHVADVPQFLNEVRRVLREGGSFFFRAPNRHHYVGLLASATPLWFHEVVANRARGKGPDEHDPWPTYYRFNSRRAIERQSSRAGFRAIEIRSWEGPPNYMIFNSVPFLLGVGYERFVNRYAALKDFRAHIFARMS